MLKKVFKIVLALTSLAFLSYMLMPGPSAISDFPALPDSTKSSLEGDTVQVPNVSAYFSDNFRDFATTFYRQSYQASTKFFFPPMRLNYPPEYAYTAIKDQTESTYLEEFVYPFRDSLFVNGMEPVNEDGSPRFLGAGYFLVDGKKFATKVTLRFYPSNYWARVGVWLGINLSVVALYFMAKRIFKNA